VAVVPLVMTFDGHATEMGFQALVAVGKRPNWETILTSDRSDYIPHENEEAPVSQHGTVGGMREGLADVASGIEEFELFGGNNAYRTTQFENHECRKTKRNDSF